MILFLTLFAGAGGILLGYGIVGMRVKVMRQQRDNYRNDMLNAHEWNRRMQAGEINIQGLSEGSAASWKQAAREAQDQCVAARREANRLREELDRARELAGIYDSVLPEMNENDIIGSWPEKAAKLPYIPVPPLQIPISHAG